MSFQLPTKNVDLKKLGVPVCPFCGGAMEKATILSSNPILLICSALAFAYAIYLLFGADNTQMGLTLLVLAVVVGGNHRRVLRCGGCKAIFNCE